MYEAYNAYLTTFDAFKVFQRDTQDNASWNAANTEIAVSFIQQASQEIIDSVIVRLPLPYLQTLTLRRGYLTDNNLWPGAYEYRLRLPDDIVSITSITWVGTALTSTQYRLADENAQPNSEIAVDRDAVSTLLPGDFDESVTIAGIFGYVPQWANAWVEVSGATVTDDPLSAAAKTLNVTTGKGSSFEEYQYIRIESEYLLITAIGTDALTVERGVLGTTAAAHVQTTQIDKFVQQATIKRAATEYAAYLYKTKGNLGEQVQVFAEGTQVNNGLSARLLHALRSHRKHIFRTA